MVREIRLQWGYTPEDSLEEPYNYSFGKFSLEISGGRASIVFEAPDFEAKGLKKEEIENNYKPYVIKAIKALSITSRKPILLSGEFTKVQIDDDGKKTVFGSSEVNLTLSVSTGWEKIGPDGEVIYSSKKRRLQKRDEFTKKILVYGAKDSRLDQLLTSFNNSLTDPDNELIYLYEILEGIRLEIGSNYLSVLGISKKRKSELGKIANEMPFKEGRHRGDFPIDELKAAPQCKKERAREIALEMMEAYVDYLKKKQENCP